MPATDPLAPAPATPAAPAPAAPAAPPPSPAATVDDINRLVGAIEGWSQKVVKAIPGAPAPQRPAPTPQPAQDDDALTAIASNGWKPVEERVAQLVNKTLQDTLVPYLGAQAGDAASANEAAIRTQVDTEFGEGTYKELFADKVEELFGDNTASKAIRSQWERAAQLVKGERFGALADRRAKLLTDKAAADEEAKKMARSAPFLPGRGGYYSPDAENTLSDDEREQLKKTKDVTGWAPSEEDAAKIRNLAMSKRSGVTLDDFNKAFPLPKGQ